MGADERFRCSLDSARRTEPVAGSATHVRTWLLLEHSGPWGPTALRDARLPDGLGAQLERLAVQHRAKVLLIRRPRAAHDPERLNVFAAYADPSEPVLEHGTVADLCEVLDLDLAGLRSGRGSGLRRVEQESVFAVCTNGRHDACCAVRGRPVAMALDDSHPDQTWEVSHIGGDRFAGNLVVLPHGLYYGRLDPDAATDVAETHLAGRMDLRYLRGRSSYPMPVQAAEIRLRRELGLTGLGDVRLIALRRAGEITLTRWVAGPSTYDVTVRTTVAERARLTCKSRDDGPVPHHEVVRLLPAESFLTRSR